LENGKYEHCTVSSKIFCTKNCFAVDGAEIKQRLHAQFAERYEALANYNEAIHHALQSPDCPRDQTPDRWQ